MQKLVTLLTVLLFATTQISAQKSNYYKPKRYANNASNYYKHQSHLLDSVIAHYVDIDENNYSKRDLYDDDSEWTDDVPADDIYGGVWGTSGVNAFRTPIKEVPDSVVISCKGFVAPVIGYTTSKFGPRWHRMHYGIDIGLKTGDPVGAAFSGKVRITRFDRNGYGYYVVIRHPNGLETVYGHLSEIKVFEGQSVVAGQTIGLGGSTGRSTGPHLHFETRFLGNPINPEKIIDFETNTIRAENYFLVKSAAFDYNSERPVQTASTSSGSSRGGRAKYYKVRHGDTLSSIAARNGTTIQKICKLNRITRRTVLRPGQKLRCS
ncbi:MAG: peptidoglycan DD-metalloendopeptidase family protein [Paludibacteraceae bacterium]|nr:peptidoglycan DD-metalloendopeptidase family protein [Paludibacteraceae bacterium]